MVVYCSPECAKQDWFGHKPLCPGHKRDGETLPRWKAILEQFPWTARGYVSSGAYHNSVVLIQFGLLGTDRKKVGYWVETRKNLDALMGDEVHKAPWTPLSEQEGWRLPKEQIPPLERLHEPNATRLNFPPAFDDSWRSYYHWRGLPMTSPAALLLHWPLTVYACLKAAGITPVYEPGTRRKLSIFYVGAQDEITFIPVFGELALLFPNTDLDMIMFGPTVRKSVAGAITRGDIEPSARHCVFKYTSPASCGGSTIRVLLDAKDAHYFPSRNLSENPDAIVALNAGLGTYPSWNDVIYLAAELSIPFVVTDYSEAGVLVLTKMVKIVDVEKTCSALREAKERPAQFNEFMNPAHRFVPGFLSPKACSAF
ncbi:hypothetical protein FB45DRAFT_1129634, partial [Roridomyces roridus]